MKDKKFLIIDSRPFGLGSILLHTLDNIKWAEDNGYIPVVRWGPGRYDVNFMRKGENGNVGIPEEKEDKIIIGEDGGARIALDLNDKDNYTFDDKKNLILRPIGAPKGKIEHTNFVDTSKFSVCEEYGSDGVPRKIRPLDGPQKVLKHCLYIENEADNCWDYYFEPLNEYTIEQALKNEHKVSDIFQIPGGVQDCQIMYNVARNDLKLDFFKDSFLIGTTETYWPIELLPIYRWTLPISDKQYCSDFVFQHRKKVNDIFKKIKIKKHIIDKVEKFKKENFGDYNLGVHIRATDKPKERGAEAKIDIKPYIGIVKEYVGNFKSQNLPLTIFLATDAHEAVKIMKEKFKDSNIITQDCIRMQDLDDDIPIPLSKHSGRQHGEECLIDMLLLSNCHHMIGCDSNVVFTAAYMNPYNNFILIDNYYDIAISPQLGAIKLWQ